jgi:hypothetical protein
LIYTKENPMKTFLAILTLLVSFSFTYGQKAMTFEEAQENGIKVAYLDSTYKSGIHSDTSLAVFKTNESEYIDAYKSLLKDLNKYLKENNFLWKKTTRGFNRIYFNKDGKIDYFLYNFRPDQLTREQEQKFAELLSKFIEMYQFPLKASTGFAQCSPVSYMPAEK